MVVGLSWCELSNLRLEAETVPQLLCPSLNGPWPMLQHQSLALGAISQSGKHRHRALGNARRIGQDLRMAKPALDLSALTPDEKLELIDDLWGSLKPEDFVLTAEQQDELDRRLDLLDREGPTGNSWEAVRAKMTRGAQ